LRLARDLPYIPTMQCRNLGRVLVVVLAACSGGQSPGPIVVTEGRICLFSGDPLGPGFEQRFDEDREVFVRFTIDNCLSSSCTRDPEASCAVRTDGPAGFEIDATATWIDTTNLGQGCTDDCLQLGATCTTPPLAAGSYLFTIGVRSVTLEIPSASFEPPCTF
jgi:hypothetical protein